MGAPNPFRDTNGSRVCQLTKKIAYPNQYVKQMGTKWPGVFAKSPQAVYAVLQNNQDTKQSHRRATKAVLPMNRRTAWQARQGLYAKHICPGLKNEPLSGCPHSF